MGELSKYPNIGKKVEEQLNQVGINTFEELKETGAKAAWLRIQEIDESACIHRLMALEGAIQGVKKTMLSDEVKENLKLFYKEHKYSELIDKEQVIKGTDQAIYESEQEMLNGAEAIDAEVVFTDLEKKYFE